MLIDWSNCDGGRCPRVLEDSETGDLVVQGYVLDDVTKGVLGAVPDGEQAVRLPRQLVEAALEAMGRAT